VVTLLALPVALLLELLGLFTGLLGLFKPRA
jgi:hypothetical protein